MALIFTPNKITDLDDLKSILKDFTSALTAKNINNFVSGLEDASSVIEDKKAILASEANAKKLYLQVQAATDTALAKERYLKDKEDKVSSAEAELKSQQAELKKSLENYAILKADLDKQLSIADSERMAASAARKASEDELFSYKQKNAELDKLIAERTAQLNKLKEI